MHLILRNLKLSFRLKPLICLCLLSILAAIPSFSQYNKLGYPFIKNFSSKEIDAPGANTAILMNSKGVLYFANTSKGIIEYDGKSWNKIRIDNSSQPMSLAVDSNDVVYVGSVGEIGYIAPDEKGNSIYHSLTHLIDTAKFPFAHVRRTYATPKGIFFCSNSYIFHFQPPKWLKPIKLPSEAFISFYLDNRLINGFYKVGLQEVTDSLLSPLPGVDKIINQDVTEIIPTSNNEWLIFTGNGLFIYNSLTKKVNDITNLESLKTTNKYFSKSLLYNGCLLPKGNIAIATLNNGLFNIDKSLNICNIFNSNNGLHSSTITDVFFSKNQGIIWLALDNGLSRIEYNSPFKIFGKESNLEGTVLSAIKSNGAFYVGTVSGLYLQTYTESGIPWFREIENLKGKAVYSLAEVATDEGKKIVAGTLDAGIYQITGTNAVPISEKGISSYSILVSKKEVGTFYSGSGTGGVRRGKFHNGKWSIVSIPESGNNIYSLFQNNRGEVWASTSGEGIIKISTEGKVIYYSTNDCLPTNTDLRLYYNQKDDAVLCATNSGIYQFNQAKNIFEPCRNIEFKGSKNIINTIQDGADGSFWINRNYRLIKITQTKNEFIVDSTIFKRLPDLLVESIYNDPDGITWICSAEGLISYNNSFKDTSSQSFFSLIRKITSNNQLIFGGAYSSKKIIENDTIFLPLHNQPDYLKPRLSYKNNNLTFDFASPYFQEENSTQFSYFLEGFSQNWSMWSSGNQAVYTNLPEGDYTFKLCAKNIFDKTGTIDCYSFTILPPWYRTIWAYIGYIIAAIAVLIISVKFYTRKLEADKKRLEGIVAERTAEVVKQKVEIEHKNKEITSSIVYAKRIQEAMLPVKDQVSIPNLELFVYFRPKDIVSGDFFFLKQIPETYTLIASAVDCTGHGVPGAFMSMLGISFLNELSSNSDGLHSDEILNNLRLQVIASLNPKGIRYETKDGMDIALIIYNYKTNRLEFSGANNPLYHIRDGVLNEIKADKMPIGLHERCGELFHSEEIIPQPGDIIYMFSDGFEDQFGGEKGKKYMSKNFKEFLLSIHQQPMEEQERLIAEESIRWRGNIEQIDDQVVMGIRFLNMNA